jgi:uncharacterized protein (DUF2237 family)
MQKNVFGLPLEECSNKPLTGFYRDGSCKTGNDDVGVHTVCVIVTDSFLSFSREVGNDPQHSDATIWVSRTKEW